jgi:Flp pilus assembly protein TadD
MDALKKAEKAKQGPISVFGDPPSGPPTTGGGPPTIWPELSIDPRPADLQAELGIMPPAEKPALRRSEPAAKPLALDPLPAPSAPADPPPPRVTESAAAPHAPAAADKSPAAPAGEAADRVAAKRVFSAKQSGMPAHSRTPFYSVVAALLLAGVGGAYYVWTETQAPPGIAAKGPAASAAGAISAAPTSAVARAAAPMSTAGPTPTTPPATPAIPPQTDAVTTVDRAPAARPPAPVAATPPPVSPPSAATVAESQPVRPAPAPPPLRDEAPQASNAPAPPAMQAGRNGVSARGGTPVGSPANLRITRDRPGPGVDPAVGAGYAALAEGNLEAAREHYNRALEADNTNRDALLGLATIASRTGRRDIAENMYRRVLELQPRDPYATAQLTALHDSADAAGAESRVKSLLANQREPASAAPLQFALGNQMAAQGRWAEAQQAYFTAYSAESDNPDYCYNLAVSLDQLRQTRLAQDFYSKAIALSSNRRAGFDPARAKARLEQLANPVK